MNTSMMGRDVWLKYTAKDGKSHTAHHVVWDKDLFLATRRAEALKEGGKVEEVLRPPLRPK